MLALLDTARAWQARSSTLDIWTSDLQYHNVPLRAFVGATAAIAGEIPLWVPGIYSGVPLLPHGEGRGAQPVDGGCSTVCCRWRSPPLNVGAHVARAWLAGFGTGAGGAALRSPECCLALVAGVAFMLCGFAVEHVKHMNLHHTAAWLPWLVVTVDRMRESPGWRTALALGAVTALQLTEGHPQMVYVSLFALVPVAAAALAPTRPTTSGCGPSTTGGASLPRAQAPSSGDPPRV